MKNAFQKACEVLKQPDVRSSIKASFIAAAVIGLGALSVLAYRLATAPTP